MMLNLKAYIYVFPIVVLAHTKHVWQALVSIQSFDSIQYDIVTHIKAIYIARREDNSKQANFISEFSTKEWPFLRYGMYFV